MKKTNTKQKGITLIALIITIIVMLILVGVSVNIALNNGLFKATQNAARETEAEKVKEKDISGGKITIIENGTEKEVDIRNVGLNAGEVLVAQNPTYKLKVADMTYLIDENTTYEELFNAENFSDFKEEIEYGIVKFKKIEYCIGGVPEETNGMYRTFFNVLNINFTGITTDEQRKNRINEALNKSVVDTINEFSGVVALGTMGQPAVYVFTLEKL